ncbi:SRPBCC family protein [Streptomyces kaniharaensis]|uniref:SRPBCC family protein n=1 Tax=Streptomyces kaniharaensis TaxID=212423 RepID=UPI002DDD7374|nr:SRPBCC family protein [Streptomyces kaniharaensis]
MREQAQANPGTNRLMEELEHYLETRAELAVAGLGHRLGRAATRLAQPGGGTGGLVEALSKGGKKLGVRASPGKAVLLAGASRVKDAARKAVETIGKDGGQNAGGQPAGTRTLTVIEDIDVGVPVREAYNQWTQFEEFGRFAKGVLAVEQRDDATTDWRVKVGKAKRSWRGKITEQVPDERIAWASEGEKGTTRGVVTFHPLGENLTKVLLVLEYFPKGMVEKTGSLVRAQGRRARLDLKRYRAFLMLRGEATGGWRGEIHEGRVVGEPAESTSEEETPHDDEQEEEPYDEEEEEEEEEPYDEEEEEEEEEEEPYDEEDFDEEEEDDEEEEPAEEERPRRRSAARR